MKTLLISLGALCLAQAAAASPCGDRIAKLQAQTSAAAAVTSGATAAESADAKLHRQPAPATSGSAKPADSEESLREAKFQNDLFRAQAAEHSGDMKECEAAVSAAEKEMPR